MNKAVILERTTTKVIVPLREFSYAGQGAKHFHVFFEFQDLFTMQFLLFFILKPRGKLHP